MFTKKQSTFFLVCSICIGISSVNAISITEIKNNITEAQQSSGVSYDIKTNIENQGGEVKGLMGNIIANIFNTSGRVKNEFISAFQNINTSLANNILKWDGSKFIAGSIIDTGGRIGIGTSSPQTKFHVVGEGRLDGGLEVDGNQVITPSGNGIAAYSPTSDRYGFFKVWNSLGNEGAYFGYGNGGNRVDLSQRGNVNRLYVNFDRVGIGISSPSQKLDVNGKIRMRSQTSSSDSNDIVATKGYVDNSKGVKDLSLLVPSTASRGGEVSSRNINTSLNKTGQYVTFYSATQDTANYLCREKQGKQFGYWGTIKKPTFRGWAFNNLAITSYINGKRQIVCTDSCHTPGALYGAKLYCYNIEGLPAISGEVPSLDLDSDAFLRKLFGGTEEISCFTAGTNVTLADGSQKNIEDIIIGEKILGEGGKVNTVLGYDRPELGNRLLYAFNGGDFFVTSEHPFKTKNGWKSLSVEAFKKENPSLVEELNVTTLQVGDEIMMEDGTTTIIRSIESKVAPNQTLYNFHLDGNNTYYANGFLVHNKPDDF